MNFTTKIGETKIIRKIAERAVKEDPLLDLLHVEMDITATHLNGCPLKLEELMKARDFDFVHDVYGINRHLDRKTGKLQNCFLPRYAVPE